MADDREAWCRDLQARLDDLTARMRDLDHAEEAERVDRPGHPPSPELTTLREKRDAASRSLARCEFTEQDDWIGARGDAEAAWRDVSDAFERAMARFRGRGQGG
ncbi:hypothetical protein [Caenispirillum bisanense]|uniref:Uncharacterized protein n=1 Tax=Caenispirillum bisanense TaxID=414052 RepID=A0A286G9H8_9PROT|nr:hypothetical protein [Caenispirillum bisanense]SOD92213.1 hypothetical protein SAMN05421508_102321 [Caenispirillum bisanense]